MANKYNPYNDYKKIVGYKGDWHNARSFGQDPNQYRDAAMPYYQSLIDNGYGELADALSQSDYTQAKGLRDKYGLKPDNEYNLDQDYNNLIGTGTVATNVSQGMMPNADSVSNLMNLGNGTTGMAQDAYNTARGIATGQTPITPSAATQGLLGAYNRDQDRLNGAIRYDENGNVVSGLNTEHYNIGRNQLDYYNNFDITKQPYYQGIMDAYTLGGYNAAQGEYANGAANNSGNIDSYAAANANRQQLAFTTAGMQQAMAMAQQNANNWNNLYAQMSNDLANQGEMSLETLKVAKDMYAKDADERMAALDIQGALAKEQMLNAISELETLKELAVKDADVYNEIKQKEMEIARDLEQTKIENDRMRYESDNLLKGTLDTNEKDLEGTKYKADADVATAGINANADMYSANRRAQADEYASLMGYNSDVYRADTDLSKVYAQAEANRAQSEYENQIQREYAQWLIDNGYTPTGAESSALKALYADGGSGGTGSGNALTKDEAIQLAETLFAQGTAEQLVKYGLESVDNKTKLKEWFKGFGLSDSDATSAVKSVTDENMGYPNALQDIQKILRDYNRQTPYYNYVQPKNPVTVS